MDNAALLKLWNDAWDKGGWVTTWEKAIDITHDQAAWKPHPARHCIWQNINHICIWREYTLAKIQNLPSPTHAETEAQNFAMPKQPTPAAWDETRARLKRTHEAIAALLSQGNPTDRLIHHAVHDAYHLGQIMLLRGMQGIPHVE